MKRSPPTLFFFLVSVSLLACAGATPDEVEGGEAFAMDSTEAREIKIDICAKDTQVEVPNDGPVQFTHTVKKGRVGAFNVGPRSLADTSGGASVEVRVGDKTYSGNRLEVFQEYLIPGGAKATVKVKFPKAGGRIFGAGCDEVAACSTKGATRKEAFSENPTERAAQILASCKLLPHEEGALTRFQHGPATKQEELTAKLLTQYSASVLTCAARSPGATTAGEGPVLEWRPSRRCE